MSIKLMSAIFETEFTRDFEYERNGEKKAAKASTVKLVLLAIADHANDEGQAYPGLTRLELKTALSRQGVLDTIEALKYNGILEIKGINNARGTNIYQLNLRSFITSKELPDNIYPRVVKPLDQGSKATLPVVVKPLDLNHHLTIIKPSLSDETKIETSSLNDVNGSSPILDGSAGVRPAPKPERKSKKKMMEESDLQVKAMYEYSKKAKDNTHTLIPEQYSQMAKWFTDITGLQFLSKFTSLWISGFEEWKALGVGEDDVKAAFDIFTSHNLSIISPGSLTKTLNGIVANRKKKDDYYDKSTEKSKNYAGYEE